MPSASSTRSSPRNSSVAKRAVLSCASKTNDEDVRGLFDLRLRLVETGDASSSLSCSRKPARLRVLPSGAAKQVTADFVCTGWPPSWAGTMKDLEFEIEAVDLSTQAIVNFAATSREGTDMRRFNLVLLAGVAVVTANFPCLARAAPGDTTLVSVRDPAQVTAMGPSLDAKVSGNGRYVAFRSQARDLAPGITTPRVWGYVRDFVAGTTERVTVSSNETEANSDVDSLAISRDGRFVAFGSMASNLVPNDTNNVGDVFVRDRQAGLTERVSVNSSGGQAARASFAPCISADGRYVAFGSRAPNLVAGDTNAVDDLFIRDRQTAQTRRISLTSGGIQANGSSYACNFSADARFVVFISNATNLVAGDTNAADDAFVRDLVANTTERVSLNSQGEQANQGVPATRTVAISADGRFVAFASGSTNLVPGDTNDGTDVFVRDRLTNQTERISVTSNGAQTSTGSFSYAPVITSDGRYVAFFSNATNLGPAGAEAGIFVRDRQASTTGRVSVSSNGLPGNSYSVWPSMSADGRYVAFESVRVGPGARGRQRLSRRLRTGPSGGDVARGLQAPGAIRCCRQRRLHSLLR